MSYLWVSPVLSLCACATGRSVGRVWLLGFGLWPWVVTAVWAGSASSSCKTDG